MSDRARIAPRLDRALALMRAGLLGIILVSEELIEARHLADSGFFLVLGIAGIYAAAAIAAAFRPDLPVAPKLIAYQSALDLLLLAALAYTSGGAFSDVRKAFFVIPLAAAFSECARTAAGWSLAAVVAFSAQAALARGHLAGARNDWIQLTANQDLYLAWTGAAGTMLALALRARSSEIASLAAARHQLVNHAIESIERERTRLAGALHDMPVQNLIAARHDLRRAQRTADSESFRRLGEALDSTISELRQEIFDLHPHVLDHVGLAAALEQVAERHRGDTGPRVLISIDASVGEERRDVLFAIARELLLNALRHAAATTVRVTGAREGDTLVLTVADDGRGIASERLPAALRAGHIGLATVRERAEALGGSVEIESSAERGTTVRVGVSAVSDRVTPVLLPRVSTAPA